MLIELGVSPLAIRERLGHERVETTLNIYSHLYPSRHGDIADKLEGGHSGVTRKIEHRYDGVF